MGQSVCVHRSAYENIHLGRSSLDRECSRADCLFSLLGDEPLREPLQLVY